MAIARALELKGTAEIEKDRLMAQARVTHLGMAHSIKTFGFSVIFKIDKP